MKFVAIADTHGKHNELKLPSGDILIHAGDISHTGDENEVVNFLKWFDTQDYSHKIFIAGNHDFYFEKSSADEITHLIPDGIIYLKDEEVVINGIKIWGSPITPWHFNWAFNRHRGDAIRRHWDLIPNDTDILVTHGPAFRRLDKNKKGEHLGCKDLFLKIEEIQPKFHVFGHIHESYGSLKKEKIEFINASNLDEEYQLVNSPICFEI